MRLATPLGVIILVVLSIAPNVAYGAHTDFTVLLFIVPPEFNGGQVRVFVEALAPFNVIVDDNADLRWDPGEQNITVSGIGLRRVSFTVSGYGPLVLLVNRTGAWGLLTYVDLGRSFSSSIQSSGYAETLYAPPMEGMVAITAIGDKPVEVDIGGEKLVVNPGNLLVACKPENQTIIEGNGTLTGIFYVVDEKRRAIAATPLLTEDEVSRIIGFSTAQAKALRAAVYALVAYTDGGGGILRVDSVGSRIVLDRPAAVWYMLVRPDSLALAPAPPSQPLTYTYGRLAFRQDQGLALPDYMIVLDTLYSGYALLADIDGDGKYEVPIFDFGQTPLWLIPGSGMLGVVRGGDPLFIEYASGLLTAYRGLPANPYNATDLTLRKILDNELVDVFVTRVDNLQLANITIGPRPGAGPILRGIACAFTGTLQPVRGTVNKVESTDTYARTLVPIPDEVFDSGGLIVALLTYQNTISVITIPIINLTVVAQPATPNISTQCMTSNYRVVKNNISVVDLQSLRDLPPVTDGTIELKDLASLIEAAVDTPLIPTTTQEQTTTITGGGGLEEAATIEVESGTGAGRLLGVTLLIIAIVALVVALKFK